MADATVPRRRQDEALAPPDEREAEASVASAASPRWPLLVLWALFALGVVLFLTLGTVRVGAGNWLGRRMTVPRIWGRFLDFLADQGASQPVVAVVVAAAVIAIVGSVGLVWLAFGVQDNPPPGDLPGP